MNRHLFFALIIAFTGLVRVANAQLGETTSDFIFEHLTIQEGLPNNQVIDIVQDQQGYMWFATVNGLARYDGYAFTVFQHDSLDATSLQTDRLECLYVDREGTLWVGTYGSGLSRYEASTETFTRFVHDERDPHSISDHFVNDILEDSNGVFWVGTEFGGLNRMDREAGTFTAYRYDSDDPSSLSNDAVRVLYEDSEGTLWIGTNDPFTDFPHTGGLNRFNQETETFTRYQHDPGDPTSLIDNRVSAIYEDARGTFWVGTGNHGLHVMDQDAGTFTRYNYDPRHPSSPRHSTITAVPNNATPHVRFIREDQTGALWIGTYGSAVDRFDPDTGKRTHFEANPSNPNGPLATTIWQLYESRDGTLWLATSSGVSKIYPARGRYTYYHHDSEDPLSLPYNAVSAFHEDHDGGLWVGTWGGGLIRRDPATDRFESYRHNAEDPLSLPQDTISALTGDAEGGLWVGTWGGMSRMDTATGRFEQYRHDPNDPASLSDNRVQSMLLDGDGDVWVGTRGGGLNRVNPLTGRIMHYGPHPSRDLRTIMRTLDRYDEEGRSLAAVLMRGNGVDSTATFEVNQEKRVLIVATTYLGPTPNVPFDYGWIADTFDESIWKMQQTKSFALGWGHMRVQVDTLVLMPGRYHLRYHTKTYSNNWNGSPPDYPERYGIQVYSLPNEAKEGSATQNAPNAAPFISGLFVTALFEDRSGAIWVGTDAGLDRYDKATDSFVHYALPRQNLRFVASIEEDRQGRLFLALNGAGLYRLNTTTGAVTRVDPGGIEDQRWLRGILADETGWLWLNSSSQLTRLDPDTEVKQTYNAPILNFYSNAYHRKRTGTLLFGGAEGFVALDPARMMNLQSPEVQITGLRLYNEPMRPGMGSVLDSPIWETESIKLHHAKRDVTIDFVGLLYNDVGEITYTYQLEGYDAEWIGTGKRRSARYPRLSEGSYTFRVKAVNSSGIESKEATLVITILPPWWKTWWAYGVYLLAFIGLMAGTFRLQRRRLLRHAQIEQVRLRAEAAEMQARALEAEHERDRIELEKARELETAYHTLKTTQAQLVQSEKMASLGQLTSGIAHELKNPLNFVNNFAELNAELTSELIEDIQANPEVRGKEMRDLIGSLKINAEQIAKHGKRADRIVQDMMEHAHDASGERYEVGVNKLVAEQTAMAYQKMLGQVPGFEVQMERHLDASVGSIEMAPHEVGRALQSLLNNAFEAVHKSVLDADDAYKPMVKVTTRQVNGQVQIRVCDNGPGIPAEIQAKIFEPFFTTKPTGGGNTGLGLSLAYDIVTQGHGGTMTVESKEGKGATFVITLPNHTLA